MLNRAVLIVRPKQPYIDWATGLDDSGVVPSPEDEQTVYLIPTYEDEDEAWARRFDPALTPLRIRRRAPSPNHARKRAQRCARQYSPFSIVSLRKLTAFAIDQASQACLTGSS